MTEPSGLASCQVGDGPPLERMTYGRTGAVEHPPTLAFLNQAPAGGRQHIEAARIDLAAQTETGGINADTGWFGLQRDSSLVPIGSLQTWWAVMWPMLRRTCQGGGAREVVAGLDRLSKESGMGGRRTGMRAAKRSEGSAIWG